MTDFKKIGAALLARGYRIIPIPKGKKGPVFDNWEQTVATQADLRQWVSPYEKREKGDPLRGRTGYANGNIGILTELTPAVDLDILDASLAREMEAFVSSLIGDAPTRVGRAPKRMLVFRTETPFVKQASRFFESSDGEKHRVEVLGAGQQFVGYGIHPDTQKPYEWISFDDLTALDVSDLPVITVEQAQEVVREFERRALARKWVPKGSSSMHSGTGDEDDDFLLHLKLPLRISVEEIREVLSRTPGSDEYDPWKDVGMALHHQFQGAEEGFELWDEWAQDSSKYDYDGMRKRWDESFSSMPDRKAMTFATIIQRANDHRKVTVLDELKSIKNDIAGCLSEEEMIGDIAKRIAKAGLSEYHMSAVQKLMVAQMKTLDVNVGVREIRAAIKEHEPKHEKETPTDELEIVLSRRVLKQHFANGAHLKRFSKTWWVYGDGVWFRESDEVVERKVLETIVRLRKEESAELQTLLDRIEESRGDRINALSSTILSVIMKIVAQSDKDDPLNLRSTVSPMVVNCKNGELWFDDDGNTEFMDHDPEHNLTSQISCEYDDLAGCPTFDQSIRKVFQKAEDMEDVIRHFYEVMGYILQPTRHAAAWIMFKGPGSNGKSFLLNIIAGLMGPTSVLSFPLADIAKGAGPHFTDSLPGKLMLLDDDLRKGTLLPDDWLKKLSEAKMLNANPKFGRQFEFVSRATPVILTNSWPAATDLSEGLRRRILVFESEHQLLMSERNPQHKIIIMRDELPGVLNHLLAGFQRFLKRGSMFDVPKECEEAKERLLMHANSLIRFVKQALIVDKQGYVEQPKLYETYIEWMRHWEHSGNPLGRNKFYSALEDLNFTKVVHHGTPLYKGYRIGIVDGVGDPFEDESEDDGL